MRAAQNAAQRTRAAQNAAQNDPAQNFRPEPSRPEYLGFWAAASGRDFRPEPAQRCSRALWAGFWAVLGGLRGRTD